MAAPSAATLSEVTVATPFDPTRLALDEKIARQAEVITRQNALIAALKAKLAAAQLDRP